MQTSEESIARVRNSRSNEPPDFYAFLSADPSSLPAARVTRFRSVLQTILLCIADPLLALFSTEVRKCWS